jgi:SAM-dependent methyltransferase
MRAGPFHRERDKVKAVSQHPFKRHINRAVRKQFDGCDMGPQRIVVDRHFPVVAITQPRCDAFVAENDTAAVLHHARHLVNARLSIGENVQATKVKRCVKGRIRKLQRARIGDVEANALPGQIALRGGDHALTDIHAVQLPGARLEQVGYVVAQSTGRIQHFRAGRELEVANQAASEMRHAIGIIETEGGVEPGQEIAVLDYFGITGGSDAHIDSILLKFPRESMSTASVAAASRETSVAIDHAACQLCGGTRFTPLLEVADANFSSRIRRYRILRCGDCELAAMDPFPTQRDIDELYVQEGVFSRNVPNPYTAKRGFQLLEPLYQKYGTDLRFIATQCLRLTDSDGAGVLDVGCSTGRLLNAFRLVSGSVRLTGIDIDPKARTNAIEGVREQIVIADPLEHRFEQEFDIITMRFVIEHLLDFRPYLERAVAWLKPGGILFLSVPDIDSAQARQLKERWKLINDPQQKIGHLRWFNRNSVRRLAAEFGLRIEKCVNRGELIYHFPQPVQRVLRSLLDEEPSSGRFIRHYAPRIINATLLDGTVSQALGCGDGLYVFLRK